MGRMDENRPYIAGDLVVYRREKHSAHPGAHAQDVEPQPNGEGYHYFVTKFWVIDEVIDDRHVRIRTRRGKTQVVEIRNPLMRRANWWERLRYRARFPVFSARPVEVQPKLRTAEG